MAPLGSRPPQEPAGLSLEASRAMRYLRMQKRSGLLGEFRRCSISRTQVRPMGVIVVSPSCDLPPRIPEIPKPTRVQPFIS